MNTKLDKITKIIPLYLNILWFAVAIPSFLAPALFPNVSKITDIVFRSYSTIYFLFYLWLSPKKPKLYLQIIFSLLVPAIWVSCFLKLPHPVSLAETSLFLVLFLVTFAHFVKRGIDLGLIFNLIYFFIRLCSYANYIKMFDCRLFVVLALIDGILCTLLFVYMKRKNILKIKTKSLFGNVLAICLSVCTISIVSYNLYKNINYAFYFSEPETVSSIVEDKEINFSATGKKEIYDLVVFVNDKTVSLKVTPDEYEFYSAGDKFTVKIYKGALGQEYYLSSTWKQTNIYVEKAIENT